FAIVDDGVVEVGGRDAMRCPPIGKDIGVPLAGSHAVPGLSATPDLRFVACPTMTGSAIFDGTRKLRDVAGPVVFRRTDRAMVIGRDRVTLLERPSGRTLAQLSAGKLAAGSDQLLAVAGTAIRVATAGREVSIAPGFEVDQLLVTHTGEIIASS